MDRLSDNARKVLERRYLLRGAEGTVTESPEELFHRVARTIAAAELHWGTKEDALKWEGAFYKAMHELLFLPNSPTLMNAGTAVNQLSACFVLPVEDDMDSIFTALKQAALIQQSGGGTGFNFSHLRPRNDLALRTGGIASGPVSFMKVFDAATEQVKQRGKRRGANMGILNIEHPCIEDFVFAKRVPGVLVNFNISVGISNTFMETLERNGDWELIHPKNKKVVGRIPAQVLWDDIIESAWRTGDPGLIFLDTINEMNPTPSLGRIEATNPCGEVPLLPFEACNLGSINLSKFIVSINGSKGVDWLRLEEIIKTAVRFLDNVVEVNDYIIPEVRAMAQGNRKIGLGVMGWAELLMRLEIPYDSDKAIGLGEQIMQFIQQKSFDASAELAKQRGVFPNWEKSIYAPSTPLRNATRTSIAPTGTISIIADTSSSIEPLYALAFRRDHVLNEESLLFVNQVFFSYLQKHGLYSERIVDQIINEGMVRHIEGLPVSAKHIFRTALEIAPAWHLRHQLAFQKYTDNAVSKTINLPESADMNEVSEIYKLAWRQKARGITIYRNRSKERQVLQKGIKTGTKGCRICIEQ